jgi:hypothetical protein
MMDVRKNHRLFEIYRTVKTCRTAKKKGDQSSRCQRGEEIPAFGSDGRPRKKSKKKKKYWATARFTYTFAIFDQRLIVSG